jgi:hypothetical protein
VMLPLPMIGPKIRRLRDVRPAPVRGFSFLPFVPVRFRRRGIFRADPRSSIRAQEKRGPVALLFSVPGGRGLSCGDPRIRKSPPHAADE